MNEQILKVNLLPPKVNRANPESEFDTAKKVISRFKKFSATISDNYYYKSGLSTQLLLFRYINNLFPNKKLTLFELGPGSGFLTALLATAGHKVICMDNSQAFYIYQNQ